MKLYNITDFTNSPKVGELRPISGPANNREIEQELHTGLLLRFLIKVYRISKEMNQKLHRGLLLILLIKSVWNQ